MPPPQMLLFTQHHAHSRLAQETTPSDELRRGPRPPDDVRLQLARRTGTENANPATLSQPDGSPTRTPIADRPGLAPDRLRHRNPHLLYVMSRITGWTAEGVPGWRSEGSPSKTHSGHRTNPPASLAQTNTLQRGSIGLARPE